MLVDHEQLTQGTLPSPRPPLAAVPTRTRASVPVPSSSRSWVRRYCRGLAISETVAAVVAVSAVVAGQASSVQPTNSLFWACLALPLTWCLLLHATGAYDESVFGVGSDEYRRVMRAGFLVLAFAGFFSYATAVDLSRAFVVLAVPALTVTTVALRYGARSHLHRRRAAGAWTKRVIVVGRGGAVLDLIGSFRQISHAGLDVVAGCVPLADRARVAQEAGIPVGGLDDVVDFAVRLGADTIAVTSASETAAQYLRRLSWQLEGTGIELLVAPGLIEVAGPRLHIRPYVGFPLLSIEQPRFAGWRRIVKGGVDRGLAAVLLILLAPVMVGLALAVKFSSPGGVLYRQERVGLNGKTFTMLKFRSMVADADQRLDALRVSNISDGLLFKMRSDPRVTPVGRLLRRLSLDELPQLFNVLGGTMSLVGPRPPLPREVEGYDEVVHRRLLVKPGLTGLWQISGRSDLSWEEAIRLDLRYVENWSLALDAQIIWKTARAVLTSSGAY
jgi:exopolysaccharide biosynthesis polyprenyl glycosylphosphotransferase